MFADETRQSIKIIDFGVASFLKHDVSRAGSLPYMAPELLGKPNVQPTSKLDVWSLGCVLFEMLTGNKPFWGTKEEITKKIKDCDVDIPDFLSEEVVDLLNAIFKNENERISLEAVLEHSWTKERHIQRVQKKKLNFRTVKIDKTLVFQQRKLKTFESLPKEKNRKSVRRTITFSGKDEEQYDFVNELRRGSQQDLVKASPQIFHLRSKVNSSNELSYNLFHEDLPSYKRPIGLSRQAKKTISALSKIGLKLKLKGTDLVLPEIKNVSESKREHKSGVRTKMKSIPKPKTVKDFALNT